MDWTWLAWVGGGVLATTGGMIAEFYRGVRQTREEVLRLGRSVDSCRGTAQSVIKMLDETVHFDPGLLEVALQATTPLRARLSGTVPTVLSLETDQQVAHCRVVVEAAIAKIEKGTRQLWSMVEGKLGGDPDQAARAAKARFQLCVKQLRNLDEALAEARDLIRREVERLPPWYQPGEPG